MQLYLTSYDPSNSSYCTQDGKVVYKVVCPFKRIGQTATIWRALPKLEPTAEETLWAEKHFEDKRRHPSARYANEEVTESDRKSFESRDEQLRLWEEPPPTLDDYNKAASESELGAGLTKIAEIDFHTISSTIIHHMGNNWKASDFFRKEGWSWYGRDRIFTGPDGKEYAWKMGPTVSELFLADADPKEEHGKAHVPLLVARFSTPHSEITQIKRPASLEIFPAGEDMIEWILITFIYIEEMRQARQRSAAKGSVLTGGAVAGHASV